MAQKVEDGGYAPVAEALARLPTELPRRAGVAAAYAATAGALTALVAISPGTLPVFGARPVVALPTRVLFALLHLGAVAGAAAMADAAVRRATRRLFGGPPPARAPGLAAPAFVALAAAAYLPFGAALFELCWRVAGTDMAAWVAGIYGLFVMPWMMAPGLAAIRLEGRGPVGAAGRALRLGLEVALLPLLFAAEAYRRWRAGLGWRRIPSRVSRALTFVAGATLPYALYALLCTVDLSAHMSLRVWFAALTAVAVAAWALVTQASLDVFLDTELALRAREAGYLDGWLAGRAAPAGGAEPRAITATAPAGGAETGGT